MRQINLYLVDKSGDVCISILHDPGEDKFGYERPEERWLPIHTVETIMVSVISMLADPNDESPANLDASVSICSIGFSMIQFNVIYYVSNMSFFMQVVCFLYHLCIQQKEWRDHREVFKKKVARCVRKSQEAD